MAISWRASGWRVSVPASFRAVHACLRHIPALAAAPSLHVWVAHGVGPQIGDAVGGHYTRKKPRRSKNQTDARLKSEIDDEVY